MVGTKVWKRVEAMENECAKTSVDVASGKAGLRSRRHVCVRVQR